MGYVGQDYACGSFHMDESAKQEFITKLPARLHTTIVREETFVEASLVQDMRDQRAF